MESNPELVDYLPELQNSLGRCIEARDAKGGGKSRRSIEDGVMTEDALREIMAAEDASTSIFKGKLQEKSKGSSFLASVGEVGESEDSDSLDIGVHTKGIKWSLKMNETKSVNEVDKMIRDAVGGVTDGDFDDDADIVDTTLNCKGVHKSNKLIPTLK